MTSMISVYFLDRLDIIFNPCGEWGSRQGPSVELITTIFLITLLIIASVPFLALFTLESIYVFNKYIHRFDFEDNPDVDMDEIVQWCKENKIIYKTTELEFHGFSFKTPFRYLANDNEQFVALCDEEQAVLFKLTWGQE